MSRKATLADYGLVGVVSGSIAMLLVGIATIAISAFVGRIPWFLGVLLALTTMFTAVSLVILVATRDR